MHCFFARARNELADCDCDYRAALWRQQASQLAKALGQSKKAFKDGLAEGEEEAAKRRAAGSWLITKRRRCRRLTMKNRLKKHAGARAAAGGRGQHSRRPKVEQTSASSASSRPP